MASERSAEEKQTQTRFLRTPALIKVVGVGGGGCNAVRRMIAKRVPGVEFIVVNTDVKSLEATAGATVIQIGQDLTYGWGAGGNPDVGSASAQQAKELLRKAIKGADLVFVTAGMGGGTGTGASPVVASIARDSGALTVGVVTTPFKFEGKRRMETAHVGISTLEKNVDNLIVIHNDLLLKLVNEDLPMQQAFEVVDDVLQQGILGVSSLINLPGDINVDFADVRTVMSIPGTALMAVGTGTGEKAALNAARQAIANPLLDTSINGAKGVLFSIIGGHSMSTGAVNAAGELISNAVDRDATIFFGMITEPELGNKCRVILIATGIPRPR